jgi:serine/threonine-protein kinase
LLEVFDFGVTLDGQAFIVMEFVDGESLDDLLETHPNGLPVPDVIDICMQVCDGLQHAHENDVVHRDLKPSNVMLQQREGKRLVQVVDFGLAKMVGDESSARITATSQVVGSPIYMGPEHCSDYGLGPHMDVYSFGCMMFELLTGVPPFTGRNISELVQQHLGEEPPALPDSLGLPEELRECIKRTLAKDPAERPSMSEILTTLRAHQIALA